MFELLDEIESYGSPPFKEDDPLYYRAPWPKFGTPLDSARWAWWSIPLILENVTKEEMLQALSELKGEQ